MLEFNPNDPFPLLESGSHTYGEAKRHSAEVDDWLGLRTDDVEESLLLRAQGFFFGAQGIGSPQEGLTEQNLWLGLPVQTLLTPYTELRLILAQLKVKPGETLVDLGAAYGRMGFIMQRHAPDALFVGYECVAERVVESVRCLKEHGCVNSQMHVCDLSSEEFSPIEAEYFFIYDYGTRSAIEKTLLDLKIIAAKKPISVIARGRAARDAIEKNHPWLSQVRKPEHYHHYSIYRS